MLLVLFVSLPYFPNAIMGIIQDVPVMGSFSYSPDVRINGLINDFRFIKELMVLLLGSLIFLDFMRGQSKDNVKKASIIFISMVITLSFGISSLLFTKYFSTNMIIAGMRILIFIFIPLMAAVIYGRVISKKGLFLIATSALLCNLIITIFQGIVIKDYYGWAIGNHRLVGAFEGSGNLATFALAYAVLLFVLKFNYNFITNKVYILLQLVTLFVTVQTGTRIVMLLTLFLIFCSIYMLVTNRSSRGLLDYIFFIAIVVSIPLILNLTNLVAGRGDALKTNLENGRFTYIFEYLSGATFKEVLFGRGIGYGTNTALSLGSQYNIQDVYSVIVDGTYNTIITQFGFIGLCIVLCLLFTLIIYLIHLYRNNIVFVLTFVLVFFLISFVGNIIEHYGYLVLTIFTIYLVYIKEEKSVGVTNES